MLKLTDIRESISLQDSFFYICAACFFSFFDQTRKISCIHCDYARYLTSPKIITRNLSIYTGYEKIICVSDYTCRNFLSVIPELEPKTRPLHNLINDTLIIEKSKEVVDLPWNDETFNIVSVGRFDRVKRYEYIPQLASEIKKAGIKFKWVLLGGGNEVIKQEIHNSTSKYNVEDCVILLGETNNPYPYIANSSLLVCLSSTEACPNVINEAKILHIPVVSANFGSVYEFLEDHINGIITPMEKMGAAITELALNKELYERLKMNIGSFKYDNDAIICKLENDILI